MSKTDKSQAPLADLMKTVQEASFKSMPGLGTDWFEAMSDVGSEMLNFTAARIKQDVETQHKLLHAKELAEIQHIQAEFFQRAIDDYTAEMAKLMDMGKSLVPATDAKPK